LQLLEVQPRALVLPKLLLQLLCLTHQRLDLLDGGVVAAAAERDRGQRLLRIDGACRALLH
jgi:hypothetical protein